MMLFDFGGLIFVKFGYSGSILPYSFHKHL